MSIAAMKDYMFVSKYARYKPELKRRETYVEAVERNLDMHLRKYADFDIREEIEWAFEQQKSKRVLGSQRALQFGGLPVEKKNARLYNCVSSYCDRPRFFQEAFYLLLCGCGTGFSVQKHHVAKMPGLVKPDGRKKFTYTIPDSIEGWADALGVLISCYIKKAPFSEYEGGVVEFIFDEIRPEGSPLSSSGGKAPGPEPLREALSKVREILDAAVAAGQKKLSPIQCYDIVMHVSDAVLAGGVRRSATLCMFSPDDDEMLNAKVGNWREDNPQRSRSNNSVLLVRGETTKEQFKKIIQSTKEFGEPGFIWADDRECLYNPCVEISLYGYDEKGNSGWQFCNLTTINGKKIKSIEDLEIAARAAAIIGTLQAGYTDFAYLGSVTESITRREALLGVSITGIMDSPDIIINDKNLKKCAKIVLDTNAYIAELIGINPAARLCCIKPEGSGSLVLGSSSGVHPHHYRRYFRNIQGNRNEAILQFFKLHNPLAVEKCVWSANDTDDIITFCIEVPDGLKTKVDMNAIDLLENVKIIQKNWVMEGMRPERCAQPWLNHNVSNTVHVRDDEWDEVADYIYKNKQFFAGISLVPLSADLDYPQAPNCAVHTPKEIVREYGDGALMASGLIVDGLRVFDDLWEACEYITIEDKILEEPKYSKNKFSSKKAFEREYDLYLEQKDWLRRIEQFSDRYLDGDVRKATYLLKDVNNWKRWCDLTREYVDVDYTLLLEDEDNTKLSEEVACAGGKCEI